MYSDGFGLGRVVHQTPRSELVLYALVSTFNLAVEFGYDVATQVYWSGIQDSLQEVADESTI